MRLQLGDIRGFDSRLVISQSNGPQALCRLKLKRQSHYNNHDYSATVKTFHTADVKRAGGFSKPELRILRCNFRQASVVTTAT